MSQLRKKKKKKGKEKRRRAENSQVRLRARSTPSLWVDLPVRITLVPSTLSRSSEPTEGSLGAESSKAPVKSKHADLFSCFNRSGGGRDHTLAGNMEGPGAFQRQRHECGIIGLAAAPAEPSVSHCSQKRSAVNDNQIN